MCNARAMRCIYVVVMIVLLPLRRAIFFQLPPPIWIGRMRIRCTSWPAWIPLRHFNSARALRSSFRPRVISSVRRWEAGGPRQVNFVILLVVAARGCSAEQRRSLVLEARLTSCDSARWHFREITGVRLVALRDARATDHTKEHIVNHILFPCSSRAALLPPRRGIDDVLLPLSGSVLEACDLELIICPAPAPERVLRVLTLPRRRDLPPRLLRRPALLLPHLSPADRLRRGTWAHLPVAMVFPLAASIRRGCTS